jgi:hypothetical protein
MEGVSWEWITGGESAEWRNDNCPRLRLSEVTLQVVQAAPTLIGEDQSVTRSVN